MSVAADQVMALVFIPVISLLKLLPCSSISGRSFLIFSVPRSRPLVLLITVDLVRKIKDRNQRTDFGKYSFVNRTITKCKRLPPETLGTLICELKIYKRNEAKGIEVWRKSFKSACKCS
jgi:hypothetical protein